MKCGWLQLFLLLAILGSASARAGIMTNAPQATANVTATNASALPSYIVTLRREADQDDCARDFAITLTNQARQPA